MTEASGMESNRREMLALGALLAMFGAGSSEAAISPAPPGLMEVLHVHADANGITHAKRVRVYGNKPIPAVQVSGGSIGPGLTEWGAPPSRRFSINTVGELEAEMGDGTRHRIGKGDLVFIDDKGSKGHRSHMLTPVSSLFIIVPDDFDFAAWCGTPPA